MLIQILVSDLIVSKLVIQSHVLRLIQVIYTPYSYSLTIIAVIYIYIPIDLNSIGIPIHVETVRSL